MYLPVNSICFSTKRGTINLILPTSRMPSESSSSATAYGIGWSCRAYCRSNFFLQVAIFKNLRWPWTKPGNRIFLNFVKRSVLSYEKLKLTGCIVAVVTCYIKRMTTPCLPMIGDFYNTVIVASLVKTVVVFILFHPFRL